MSIFPRKLLGDIAKYGKVTKSTLYSLLRNASDHLARQTRRHGGQWYSCIIKNAAILSLDLISSVISCTVVLSLLLSQRLQSIIYFCISGYIFFTALLQISAGCARCAPVQECVERWCCVPCISINHHTTNREHTFCQDQMVTLLLLLPHKCSVIVTPMYIDIYNIWRRHYFLPAFSLSQNMTRYNQVKKLFSKACLQQCFNCYQIMIV